MDEPHSTQSHEMKNRGASVIFVNSSGEILLYLRDNKPGIQFPNRWDLPGGTFKLGETPHQCIIREVGEELRERGKKKGYTLVDPRLFRVTQFDDREEHTFIKHDDIDFKKWKLVEGQSESMKWFSETEVQALERDAIAFGFRPLLLEFFDVNQHGSEPNEGRNFEQ